MRLFSKLNNSNDVYIFKIMILFLWNKCCLNQPCILYYVCNWFLREIHWYFMVKSWYIINILSIYRNLIVHAQYICTMKPSIFMTVFLCTLYAWDLSQLQVQPLNKHISIEFFDGLKLSQIITLKRSEIMVMQQIRIWGFWLSLKSFLGYLWYKNSTLFPWQLLTPNIMTHWHVHVCDFNYTIFFLNLVT